MSCIPQRRPPFPQCEKQLKKWSVDKRIYKTNPDDSQEKSIHYFLSPGESFKSCDRRPNAQAPAVHQPLLLIPIKKVYKEVEVGR